MSEPAIPTEVLDFDLNDTHKSAPPTPLIDDGYALNDVPTSSVFNYLFGAWGKYINWLVSKIALFPGYSADSILTISAGVVTPTKGNHSIETQGAAASDDLTNVLTSNLDAGRQLVLGCTNPSHVVVVKHAAGGAGQIHLNDGLDYSLNSLSALLTLKRIGADWYEVGRSIQPSAVLPGFIQPYGGSSAPAGYLMCDGAAVSRSTYASLFSTIGSAYGVGDGSTTFNLPNLKGRFLRGIADYADTTCTGTPGSNNATFTGHPYRQTGVKVRLTGGSMTGLSTGTDYWIIYIDANTLAFATSLANAVAGTKISISSNSSAVISQWEDPDAASRVTSTPGAASGALVGSLQVDGLKTHVHTQDEAAGAATVQSGSGSSDILNSHTTANTGATGGNETRPYNVAVNYLIKF